MGPYPGGQAVCPHPSVSLRYSLPYNQEYLRVPFADFNALKLPAGTDHEDDFALLADIFPTVRFSPINVSNIMILLFRVGMVCNFPQVWYFHYV